MASLDGLASPVQLDDGRHGSDVLKMRQGTGASRQRCRNSLSSSSFERSIYLSFMAIPSRTLLIHSLATISDAFVVPHRVMAAFSPLTGADAGKFLFQSDGRRSGGGDADRAPIQPLGRRTTTTKTGCADAIGTSVVFWRKSRDKRLPTLAISHRDSWCGFGNAAQLQ